MGIILWIIFGLIAGIVAKFLMPGRDGGGLIMTIVLGVVGAMVGGFIATALGLGDVTGFNAPSFIIAVGGSILVLVVYRRIKG